MGDMALIHVILGNRTAALDLLDSLLAIPGIAAPSSLRLEGTGRTRNVGRVTEGRPVWR